MKEGKPHPDLIVETASLAAMEPPIPKYKHRLKVHTALPVLSYRRQLCACLAP